MYKKLSTFLLVSGDSRDTDGHEPSEVPPELIDDLEPIIVYREEFKKNHESEETEIRIEIGKIKVKIFLKNLEDSNS